MGLHSFFSGRKKLLLTALVFFNSAHLRGEFPEITFTPFEIAENSPISTAVGLLDVANQDVNESYEFQILQVTPSSFKDSFVLDGNRTILTTRSLDYESSSEYSVTIGAEFSDGERLVSSFEVVVANEPEIIDLILSNNRFPENEKNSPVGFLTAIADDNNQDASLSYLILDDDGNFSIVGNQLLAVNEFDYEKTQQKTLEIQVSATGYEPLIKNFKLSIEDKYENQAPSDLKFFSAGISENLQTGVWIGTLLGVDPDPFEILTYSLGIGGQDSDLTVSSDGKVYTNRIFDFETNDSVTLSARVTDGSGESFDGNFVLDILDDFADNNQSAEPLGGISGRVVGEDGLPVDHFEILAFDANDTRAEPVPVHTKLILHQDGDYDLKVMPGRYRLRITGAYRTQPYHQVFKPEYFAEGEIAITREVPHLPRMDWVLEQLRLSTESSDADLLEVNGTVLDGSGNPLEGIAIEADSSDGESWKYPIKTSLTNDEGVFSMNLEPGKYRFRSHDYEGKWMQASIVDEVTKGIPIKDLDFELSLRGRMTVSGNLMTTQALPANGKISFWDWEKETQLVQPLSGSHDLVSGQYSYELPLGKYLVKASDPRGIFKDSWYGGQSGEQSQWVNGESNGSRIENIDLVMVEQPSLKLLITFMVDGIPVSRPPVLEVAQMNSSELFPYDVFFPVGQATEVSGQFSYQLKREPLELRLLPLFPSKPISKIARKESSEKKLVYDPETDQWTLVASSSPKMDLVQMNGNLDLTLDLDDFNEFITGSYFALSDDNQTTNQSLEDSNTVSGSVISFDGSLLANAGIEARNYDTGITFTGRTDGRGKFLFDELSSGRWSFMASPPDGFPYRLLADSELYDLELTASSEMQMNLVLQQANLIGQAAFSDANGYYQKPKLGWCWVVPSLNQGDSEISSAGYFMNLDQAGRFGMRLPQGQYDMTMEVFSRSGQSRQRNFSFQILNPNEIKVLGGGLSASWPKVDGASEYRVQRESHFNGHYETLHVFEANQSSGSFDVGPIANFHEKYRIQAKAKHKYNNLSLVEKYLSMKSIPTLGSLQEEGEINESNSSTQMELESIPVYMLSSYDLEQLSGDQNLTDGEYSVIERFDEENRSIGIFIEPVEEVFDPYDFLGNPDKQYALSADVNDSIPTDLTYYEDHLLFEPDIGIGVPIIDFPISEFEISGFVYDQNGTLLSGIEVLAFDPWNGTLLRTFSNAFGQYGLSVGPGSWELEVGSIANAVRLPRTEADSVSEFEIPTVPITGKVMVDVSSSESIESVDFMVNMGAESILVLGQFEHLSSSESVDLQGYDAQVRFVSERAEFTASVENNGSFSLSIPKGFYEVYPWVDSSSGLYPEFESSNQKSEVFDSYEISSPYFSMTIPNDLNSTVERMIVYLDRANCQIRGSVKDLDGIPIPGAVMTALSDLGELLLTETDFLGSFEFFVRGNAYWTIQCDFIYSDPLDGNRYETPESQRFWLTPSEQLNLDFVARKSENQIKGFIDAGEVAASSYFGKEAYLKKTDLWGNQMIVSKSLIDARGGFTFQVSEGERLLGQLDSSLTVGVLADWTGVLPTFEPLEIEDNPFSVGNSEVILTPHLRQITNYPVVGQFLRDGNLETNGWVGEVYAVSMANQYDQQVESDMRVANLSENGGFAFNLPPGIWSIDYRITHAAGQNRGFEPSLPNPLFVSIGPGDNSLEPFDILTELTLPKEYALKVSLVDPSESKVVGLCYVDVVPHYTGEDKRTFSSDRSTLEVTDGEFEHKLDKEGVYDLWIFPGPQLREEGYYMPEPFAVWVDGPINEVTLTIPRGGKNLDLSSELSGQVLGLDKEPVVLENNDFYMAPIVWITSSSGLFSWTYCDWDGSFVFRKIPKNLEWYAGSSYFDPFAGKDLATLSDQGPFVSGTEGIVLELDDFSGATPMPEETSQFFDPWANFQMLLPDGLEILIPKGAVPVEPEQRVVRLVVSPSLERLHRDLLSVPVGYAYEISLFDEKGKLIEGHFRKKVKLTIPINSFFLDGMKLELTDVEVAYFDSSFNSWRPQTNQVLEAEAHSIHLLVDHFSTWVPIAHAGTRVPIPVPLGDSAQAIGDTFWYKHDWFGDYFAMPNSDWIFHSIHGWLYIEETNDNEIWVFDSKLNDWLWTSSEIYSATTKHHFFSNKWRGYVWHSPGSRDPRWFFDYDANAWFTDELRFSVNVELDNPTYGTVLGGGMKENGFSPRLSAHPEYGYSFDGWSGGVSSMENAIELAPLSRSVTLLARFSKIPPLSVEVVNQGQGVGNVEGVDSYDYGSPVLLKAVAGDRSIFMGWLNENGERISWDEKFIIDELLDKRSLKALFEPATIENILRKRYEK